MTDEPTQQTGIAGAVRRVIAAALRLRVVRAFLLYTDHRGPMLADSITYRALFSVFAAVLLGFSAAALWLSGNPDAMRALADALESVIPGISDIVDPSKIDAPVGFSIVGIASLVGLVGAAMSAIGSLRTALRMLADEYVDDVFPLWVLLRNLLVAIGFGGLLAVAAAASLLGAVGVETLAGWVGFSAESGWAQLLAQVFGVAVVLIIDALAIALVFRVLSGVKVHARVLWSGALLGGIGLTVLQQLSGLFVRGASSNPLLASFATLIALLLWFNLSAQVILIASSYIITGAHEQQDRVRTKFGAETLAQLRRQRAEDRYHAASDELRAAQEAERAEREKVAGAMSASQHREDERMEP